MGTLLAVYCENKNKFFRLANKYELTLENVRRVMASRARYCLGDNYLYLPAANSELEETDRLCWVRSKEFLDIEDLNKIAENGTLYDYEIYIGNTYMKRRREVDGVFVSEECFISETLYNGIRDNPDALKDVSRDDFESLCAEIFVKRGFEVDLFRGTKDGGIDFLAVKGDQTIPQIYAVQCKQPDVRVGKKRRALGRPVVQQIYGAAKAWDIDGAVAISGATYSKEAKSFSNLKPQEIEVYGGEDILNWIKKYKWNSDE